MTSVSKTAPTPDALTIPQRMMSASFGSILTAFILTPLDVVRIRMQQQEILPETLPCCGPGAVTAAGPNPKVSGSTPSTIGMSNSSNMTQSPLKTPPNSLNALSLKPHKIDHTLFWVNSTVNKYCNSNNCARITSTWHGFQVISKYEGVSTLWRGMSLNLIMAIPSNVVYFTGYEYVRDNSPISGWTNSLLCGSIARLFAATAIAPLELIKTRLQSIPAAQNHLTNVIMKDLFRSTRASGIRSLYTGLQITLWRDVPFSGIYWSLYEASKAEIGSRLDINGTGDHGKVFATSFVSGSFAGSVAALATHPFDVGKTRLQITSPNDAKMFRFLYEIMRDEGPRALFGGLGPRVLKVAPSCAIMISSYEITKRFFQT